MNREIIKKKMEEVLEICSKCEEIVDENLCREIDISKKIQSGFGCGKWKKEGEFILNQEFYDEIKKQVALRQVIDDLLKKELE